MSLVGYDSETDSISSGCCAGLSGSCAASEKADLKNYNGSATYQEIPHCTTEMQGYDVEFEPPLESKYECPICLMALREAVQTPCGHRFCKGCILQSIRDAGQKCPVDNEILLENQLFPDNFAKREILSLTVRCPNKGCEQRMELRKLETHTSQCLYATVPCRDCNKQVRRSYMNEHMANQCLRRLIICPNCAGSIIFEEAKTHEEECPLANVMCEYCSTELIREQLKSHCDMDCPKAPVLCTFSSFGCPEKMQRDKLAQHMQEYTQMHMHFMAMSLRSLSLTTPSHMGPILQSDSSEFHFDPAPPLTGPCTMASPISASGATGGQTPSHCDCDQNRQHLQETIHQLESRLVRQDHQIRELTAKMETQSGLVGDLKRQVRVLEEKVNELEAQQFNGIYIWKIENFSAFLRTQEADQPVVIHSPGFYTGRPGYKLCLRLHLQTPSVPRCANYISLFVHTMQGIYDSQLPWPFQGTIRLSILDQTEGPVQQNHEEVMETKPDLLAFQRPSMPRNPKGFGYVTFMHLQALRQREYIRDDTLLVRCDVTPRIDLSCIRREGFQPRGLESSM
ncbi:TNF receptor-associated factor 6 [Polypterus senegalus]|uniref:TNF receptor-associated factor 6 n=1 Tax=Polypterus senegalus TaxID=55291 RepID=UPI001964BD9C|nr:TNF receptor-associated factor 6 [Polypterus senegalus]